MQTYRFDLVRPWHLSSDPSEEGGQKPNATTQVTTAVTTTASTTTVNSTTTVITERKVLLCHKTHSTKHPYVTISVNQSAVRAHLRHGDTLSACTTKVVKSLEARDARVAKAKAKARSHHGKGHK